MTTRLTINRVDLAEVDTDDATVYVTDLGITLAILGPSDVMEPDEVAALPSDVAQRRVVVTPHPIFPWLPAHGGHPMPTFGVADTNDAAVATNLAGAIMRSATSPTLLPMGRIANAYLSGEIDGDECLRLMVAAVADALDDDQDSSDDDQVDGFAALVAMLSE